jgi:hypothetical protein
MTLLVTVDKNIHVMLQGILKGKSITVLLTSYLTGLD